MIIALNKPCGVLCQFSGQGGHLRLESVIRSQNVYPAGRLDADSEGLLILTDNGPLQHRITDPKHKLPKTYIVQVEGIPDDSALEELRTGVSVGNFYTSPCEVRRVSEPEWLWPRDPPIRFRKSVPTSWLEMVLREGKNRQVRRMTAAVGFPTLRLIRTAIGPWALDGMQPGEWRWAEVPEWLMTEVKSKPKLGATSGRSRNPQNPKSGVARGPRGRSRTSSWTKAPRKPATLGRTR